MEKTYTRTVLVAACVIVAVVAFLLGVWYKDSSVDNDADSNVSPSASLYLTATPKVGASPSVTPKAVMYTLHFTDSGIDDSSLTIRAGDAVNFVNDSHSWVWPISGNCPSLDARRGLQKGESYALVFSTRATCQFYNSLDPQNSAYKGTIIVK